VYEDAEVDGLAPLALTRPACDLWCGAAPLLDRQRRHFRAAEVGLVVRPWLAAWCRLLHPGLPVNDPGWLGGGGPLLLVSARWLPPAGRLELPPSGRPRVALVDDQAAYLAVPSFRPAGAEPVDVTREVLAWRQRLPGAPAGGHLLASAWDLLRHNAAVLAGDGPQPAGRCTPPPGLAVVGPVERLCVHPEARVGPLAVADATNGPVLVDRGAVIGPLSLLEGPCYVGPGTQVRGAVVRGSTLGPGCRVAGEVEASILQGYCNKAHGGYLGHSYLGAWVNLGAGTQTADLRNDYRTVRAAGRGGVADTGLLKAGALLGDHTRTGVGTLLDCGTVAGPFAQLLPGAGLLPRLVPAFCTARGGCLAERTDFGRVFGAAAAALRRRGHSWTEAHAEFFLALYERTAAARREAVEAGPAPREAVGR
jgi:UDP-N-acetylglucosamine diphosphorylase/glucosamine-1-phosphate N-acetyltransferase